MDQTLSKLDTAWLDLAPFPVFASDCGAERLRYCNPRAREWLHLEGVTLTDAVSKLFKNPADFAEALAQLLSKGGVVEFETDLKPGHGSHLRTRFAASLAEIDHNPVIVFSIDDHRVGPNACAQLISEHTLWNGVFQDAGVGIIILDERGCGVATNPCWVKMFGYAGREASGLPFTAWIHADADGSRWETALRTLMAGEIHDFRMEVQCVRRGGELFWCDVAVTRMRDEEKASDTILCCLIDIGDRKLAEDKLREANVRLEVQLAEIRTLQEKLSEEALRDPLTGLYNRRYLSETLPRELSRANRKNQPVSVVMMDIDHFKQLNDAHGHGAGDLVLKELGALLRGHMRGEDIACRFGGEEFVAILPGTSLETAVQRAEQWRLAFQAMRLPYEGQALQATLSFGIASFPRHGMTDEELLFKADDALYQAKRSGRNRVMVCE